MAADPYLAVTLDAKRRIAQVARALDQPHPGTAGSGLLELLEDVWRRKDPSVDAMTIAACFGSDPRMPAALVRFRFLDVRGDGWELCADLADRLLSTHRQRVAAGKARAAAAERSGGAFTSGPPAADQRATSGGPAGAPAADQLLQPAASSQQKDKEDLSRASPAPVQLQGVSIDPPAPAFAPSDLQALWNERMVRHGLPRWNAMAGTRKSHCAARLREHPEREWWEEVLAIIPQRPFLLGENDRGWKADPDFLVTPGKAESVLEGKYAGRAVSGRGKGTPDARTGMAAQSPEEDEKQREWIEHLHTLQDARKAEGFEP